VEVQLHAFLTSAIEIYRKKGREKEIDKERKLKN
jgi:hypothetical protein